MTIRSLSVHQFRNIQEASVEFSPFANYIRGENGAGKTNLLEAVFCVNTVRSFRKATLSDMVSYNRDYLRLEAAYTERNEFVYFSHDDGVLCGVNGKKTSVKELVAQHTVFAITREMFNLMYYSPSETRLFFDRLIMSVEPDYAYVLGKYKKTLDERNAVLRNRPVSYADLDVWDVFYADYAAKVSEYRSAFISRLQQGFQEVFKTIFDTVEARLVYTQSFQHELFAEIREEDAHRGTSGMGPHRDRYELQINDHKGVSSASQGQAKSSILALVAAVVLHMLPKSPDNVILLLDDVFEELDTTRKERVFELYSSMSAQLFITGIEPYGKSNEHDARFVCQNGIIERE